MTTDIGGLPADVTRSIMAVLTRDAIHHFISTNKFTKQATQNPTSFKRVQSLQTTFRDMCEMYNEIRTLFKTLYVPLDLELNIKTHGNVEMRFWQSTLTVVSWDPEDGKSTKFMTTFTWNPHANQYMHHTKMDGKDVMTMLNSENVPTVVTTSTRARITFLLREYYADIYSKDITSSTTTSGPVKIQTHEEILKSLGMSFKPPATFVKACDEATAFIKREAAMISKFEELVQTYCNVVVVQADDQDQEQSQPQPQTHQENDEEPKKGGAKKKPTSKPKYLKTFERIKIGKSNRIVYINAQGAKFVKVDGEYKHLQRVLLALKVKNDKRSVLKK
jgi:hypothetical protein